MFFIRDYTAVYRCESIPAATLTLARLALCARGSAAAIENVGTHSQLPNTYIRSSAALGHSKT